MNPLERGMLRGVTVCVPVPLEPLLLTGSPGSVGGLAHAVPACHQDPRWIGRYLLQLGSSELLIASLCE